MTSFLTPRGWRARCRAACPRVLGDEPSRYLYLTHDSEDCPDTKWRPTFDAAHVALLHADPDFVLPLLPEARRRGQGEAPEEHTARRRRVTAPAEEEAEAEDVEGSPRTREYAIVHGGRSEYALSTVNHRMRVPTLCLARLERVDDAPLRRTIRDSNESGSAFQKTLHHLLERHLRCINKDLDVRAHAHHAPAPAPTPAPRPCPSPPL